MASRHRYRDTEGMLSAAPALGRPHSSEDFSMGVMRTIGLRRIAHRLLGVDGGDSCVGCCGPWGAAVQFGIVPVDALLVVGRHTVHKR